MLRSVALALVGPENAPALRQNWESWLAKGQNEGLIELQMQSDYVFDQESPTVQRTTFSLPRDCASHVWIQQASTSWECFNSAIYERDLPME
ncbi:MAG: hypothetical protein U0841_18575 [Chloroflexia bacterium]